jgi:SAM-dependent methyltransferase
LSWRLDQLAKRKNRLIRPRWLALRRTRPLSERWGADRGQPVDRYYIDRFLAANRQSITGSVLEIQQPTYTERFGVAVRQSQVLDIDPANERATIVADLARADSVPDDSFDCFILLQTLHYIHDVQAAISHSHRILRRGGVLLCTVPCVSRIEPGSLELEHWRFTAASCRRLFAEPFGAEHVQIESPGNVLASIAMLAGIAAEELRTGQLDDHDPYFPLIVTIRAEKAGRA